MSLRHAVLGLLAGRPASGYELAKHFQRTLPHIWYARNHQLYPELSRLAADGHVEVGKEGPRGRRLYEINDSGREELRRWLVDVDSDRTARSETYLRAFLLSAALSPDDALQALDREVGHWRADRDEMLALTKHMADDPEADEAHQLAVSMTLKLSEAMLAWADEAREAIEARPRD